jgi:CPA2 family monovalent cation:H+ antiporter-2
VLIAGYGAVGQSLARVLGSGGIPRLVLETSPEGFERAAADEAPVELGDPTKGQTLLDAGIRRARSLVLALDDPDSTRRALRQARELAPELHIIVRARRVAEIAELSQLGADEVVPDELEASIEIFARVLRRLHIPENLVRLEVALIRRGNYGMLRRPGEVDLADLAAFLDRSAVESYVILQGSVALGQTLAQLDLRRRTGASVVALVREGRKGTTPDPALPLAVGDVLLLTGSHEALDHVEGLFGPEATGPQV